jgi:diguanylate cyclase (GGDEF)-like protein
LEALTANLLRWSGRVLGARSLAALDEVLAEPPGEAHERLAGVLLLKDPRHELRLLAEGEQAHDWQALRFVDALDAVGPGALALHAPWSGEYHAADHELLFAVGRGWSHVTLLPLPDGRGVGGIYAVAAHGAAAGLVQAPPEWLAHLAAQVAAGAERLVLRARLLRSGVVDPVTGWNSRHYFHGRLREQAAASIRRDEPAACLIVDVDGLSHLNERHGVAAGDLVLAEIGSRVESQVRASDSFACLGEDAFAVLLPATTAGLAVRLGERILAAVRAAPCALGAGLLEPVTVSVGIAGLRTTHAERGTDCKALADQWFSDALAALHAAKRTRNALAVSDAGAASAAGK